MQRLERDITLQGFGVAEIRLMKSVLRPSGAEHTVVHRVSLEHGA